MLDRLGQELEVGDYIWYTTKTHSPGLQIGRIQDIIRKPSTAERYYGGRQTNRYRCVFKIKVQWEGDSPSWLEEHVYFELGEEPVVQSNRFLKATVEQAGRELVRRTTATP